MNRRVIPLLFILGAVLMGSLPAFAGKPLFHDDAAQIFTSEWGIASRAGPYGPQGVDSASPLMGLGLRYKVADRNGSFAAIGYELAYDTWDSSPAEFEAIGLNILLYARPSQLFRMKHNPYYGLGAATLHLTRKGIDAFSEDTLYFIGGIEIPYRRFHFDISARFIYGSDDRFDLDGTALTFGVVYYFGQGRAQ